MLMLSQLRKGDYVVHEKYGIGRYMGLKSLRGASADMLDIQYADGRVAIPAYNVAQLHKYDGTPSALSAAGDAAWRKSLKTAKAHVEHDALELAELYAARAQAPGYAFPPPGDEYMSFEAGFEYNETAGQEQAIREITADMLSPTPMDRLVMGDVGTGKTEVAMRAAMLALGLDDPSRERKQVVVLAPTQILATQHYATFVERFKAFPVTVVLLHGGIAHKAAVLQQVADGSADIIIGTHAVLGSGVACKDVGLLIVDEEHRFGTRAKETLQKQRALLRGAHLDVLWLSATPIPRTLAMTTYGFRAVSEITEQPAGRQGVQVHVVPLEDRTIQRAIRDELARGGQVFYVHNRVQRLDAIRRKLQQLVPDVRIGIAHGQNQRESAEAITAFRAGNTDVLLATTIIENGVDIPNANTIIVDDLALGLQQFWQLQGRVGRGAQRGVAYLLTPADGKVSDDLRKRLEVIRDAAVAGGGHAVARRDLMLRGQGELLGVTQSGHLMAIGVAMYEKLLRDAMARLAQTTEAAAEPAIETSLPKSIPPTYVADDAERLLLYTRMASASADDVVTRIASEMVATHGRAPEAVLNLVEIMRIRLRALRLHIESVTVTADKAVFQFSASTPVPPAVIMQLVASNAQFHAAGGRRLEYVFDVLTRRLPLAATRSALKTVLTVYGDVGGDTGEAL